MSDDFNTAPPAPPTPPPPPPPPSGGPVPGAPAPSAGGAPPAGDTGRILAALSYPIWIVALIAILLDPYKDDKWIRAHAIQALGLGVVIWVLTFVLSYVFIGFFVGIAGFVYQIILAVKAWNGESVEIPVVYNIVKQYI